MSHDAGLPDVGAALSRHPRRLPTRTKTNWAKGRRSETRMFSHRVHFLRTADPGTLTRASQCTFNQPAIGLSVAWTIVLLLRVWLMNWVKNLGKPVARLALFRCPGRPLRDFYAEADGSRYFRLMGFSSH